MTVRRQILRRIGCGAARLGAVSSAGMLALTILGITLTAVSPASAATDGGPAQVVTPIDGSSTAGQPLATGGSATAFSLRLPVGAACTGDSANDGYRVQSYMVPDSVDPAGLTFGTAGPLPGGLGAAFRQPLYETTSTGYVNAQTANATTVGGPGPVVNVPAISLELFAPGDVPSGEYNLGIACTKGTASATQLDKFWNARMTVVTSAADQPAGITWTATPVATTTTSSTTTSSTTTSSTTSTTVGGSTSTTDRSTSTSIGSGDSTTTSEATVLAASGGSPSGTSVMGSVIQLPVTGSSSMALVVWSVLLLVFGRMAILLGRPQRVTMAARA